MTTSTAAGHLSSPNAAQKSPFARMSTILSSVSGAKSWSMAAWKLKKKTSNFYPATWFWEFRTPPELRLGNHRRSLRCPLEPHRWGRTSILPDVNLWSGRIVGKLHLTGTEVKTPTYTGVPVPRPEKACNLGPKSRKCLIKIIRTCLKIQTPNMNL